jgi:competence protein ComGF
MKHFKHSQLKAFTLMEIIVSMVLTGIITAASLSLYLNYSNLVRKKNNQMHCSKENLQFYQIFKHEFDQALVIKKFKEQVTFVLPDKAIVSYEFDPDFIVRSKKEQLDTFFIKAEDFEALQDKSTSNCIVIKMTLQSCGESYPVFLNKTYSNDILMNSQ